ncbi:hypothetical protein BB427_15845 [Pseudoalteromonas sp. BMB]|uniref:hypothetical protein n=1 Tax=Pseudoalteromonas sp. BMB TaxID=1874619 RepID=UPI00083D9371|nr:hypothetical protein [Pseudoalteromonas sp. BMB]ODB36410.1 hypothetical protein BB427_15845 [Pseudoalteromonas sp. BMB]
MKIVYNGKQQKVIDAVDYVNDLFDEDEFWKAIEDKGTFDYSAYSAKDIAGFMRDKEKIVEVKLYRPRWPRHRKTNAYTDPKYPNTLFYNSKKLWRGIGNIVNTIVHEYVHSVDFTEDHNSRVDYGHGNQSSSGKGNAAPYWIGDLAEKFYETENTEAPVIESISIDPSDIVEE